MNSPLRYGVVGTGMMGVEHIANILALDGASVTAAADPHPPSQMAARVAAGDQSLPVFESHVDLIESGLCDAVVVATPNMTHVGVLLDLMETDLHVLVEKPLCTTVADCRRVCEADAQRDAITWMGLEYRYMPSIARLITEVRQGTVGDVRMVSIREHRFPFLDKVGDWNRFNQNTGGTLVEKCCHYFDLMNHITDSEPVRVYASGGQDVNHLDETYDGRRPDILDNAYVVVDYRNGVRAMLDLCMFAEGGRNQEEVVVVGDLGKVEAHNPSSEIAIGGRGESRFSPRVEKVVDQRIAHAGLHHGASYLEHMHFLAAVRGGSHPLVTLEDGLLAVAMGVAAHRSIEQRRPIEMHEVLGPQQD